MENILYNTLGGNMLENRKYSCQFIICNYKPRFCQADTKMYNQFYKLSALTMLKFFRKYYSGSCSICQVEKCEEEK